MVALMNHELSHLMLRSRDWYTEQNHLAQYWAEKYGYSVPQVCGIIASLSPMITWNTNLKWAHEVLTSDNPSNYMFEANLLKALRIKDGESPASVLGGRKVRSFYHNLLRPHGSSSVTIDRHMLRLVGHPRETITPKQYSNYERQFQTRAKAHNLHPSQYQAILWCLTRGKVD